jgi:hypothetical protein
MKKEAFLLMLGTFGIFAALFAQTAPATRSSVDRRYGIERLSALLPDAQGAAVVSFKTDALAGQRTGGAGALMIPLTGYSPVDHKIRIQGEFALTKEVFGQENRPKLGHVELEIPENTSMARPSPVIQRFMALYDHEPDDNPRLFILLAGPSAPGELGQCTFIGPLDPSETDSVVECVKFMKQHPTVDEQTRQSLLSSLNPWLKELATSLSPTTAPATTTPTTTTKKAP